MANCDLDHCCVLHHCGGSKFCCTLKSPGQLLKLLIPNWNPCQLNQNVCGWESGVSIFFLRFPSWFHYATMFREHFINYFFFSQMGLCWSIDCIRNTWSALKNRILGWPSLRYQMLNVQSSKFDVKNKIIHFKNTVRIFIFLNKEVL